MKNNFTKNEKRNIFYMLLIGESVLGMLEDYRGKNGDKHEKTLDKIYALLAQDKDTKFLIEKFKNHLIPTNDIDIETSEILSQYCDYNFWETLAIQLGKRDFLEQGSKEELGKLKKKKFFPFSLSKYIEPYEEEFETHGIRYLRAIPPHLITKFQQFIKNS